MSKQELPKAYDFKSTEPRVYAMWETAGYFKPRNDPNQPDFDPTVEPFVITIPPPNVTGELHVGPRRAVRPNEVLGKPESPTAVLDVRTGLQEQSTSTACMVEPCSRSEFDRVARLLHGPMYAYGVEWSPSPAETP